MILLTDNVAVTEDIVVIILGRGVPKAFIVFLIAMGIWLIFSIILFIYIEVGKEGFKKLEYKIKKVFKYLSSKTETTVYLEDNNAIIITKFLWATYKVIYNKETKLFNIFVGKKKGNDDWLEWVHLVETKSVKEVESFFDFLLTDYDERK